METLGYYFFLYVLIGGFVCIKLNLESYNWAATLAFLWIWSVIITCVVIFIVAIVSIVFRF